MTPSLGHLRQTVGLILLLALIPEAAAALDHRDHQRLLALLDDYGADELGAAVARALEQAALGAGSIAHILETRRRQRGRKPPLPVALPDRPSLRELDVRPHPLESYDALTRRDPDDPGE